MSIGVVIPAAGQGSRMNSKIKKQFLKLGDKTVLAHTLSVFINNEEIDQIVIVVHPDEIELCRDTILDGYNEHKIKIVAGGKTRRESVFAGLKAFSPVIEYVIIHDGARPLLTDDLLKKVIESLSDYKAITIGTRMKDTVKLVDENGIVQRTPERGSLMAIQTPQAFLYNVIMEAHQKVPLDVKVTDDASLVEYMGIDVKIIAGKYENIKITTPLDLIIAENIIKKRKQSSS